MLLDTLGRCGTVRLKGRNAGLPVLVGEPAEMCPTAAANDPDVMLLMEMVPGPAGPGSLSTIPRHELPAHLRALLVEADRWLAEYRLAGGVTHG